MRRRQEGLGPRVAGAPREPQRPGSSWRSCSRVECPFRTPGPACLVRGKGRHWPGTQARETCRSLRQGECGAEGERDWGLEDGGGWDAGAAAFWAACAWFPWRMNWLLSLLLCAKGASLPFPRDFGSEEGRGADSLDVCVDPTGHFLKPLGLLAFPAAQT